jgi:TonB-dependent SusC/RagA subfamily outer membrane receptor
MLAARVSGLEVLRSGNGTFALRVRGIGAMSGGYHPLIVIDGMPIGVDATAVLAALSARDVRSVEVLKDPSSIAVYGSRGANGVVLFNLRRGR